MEKLTMDKKLKIIFVGIPDMALVCLANLLEKGFNIIKTGINYKYPQKDIYYFAWTEELNNALILIGLPSRKDIVKKF